MATVHQYQGIPSNNLHILFFGTSSFAVPVLQALMEQDYRLVGVVTTPDEPTGRKQILTASPLKSFFLTHRPPMPLPHSGEKMKEGGQSYDASLLQPRALDANFVSRVRSLQPNLFIVAAYGKILPAGLLALPRCGALNLHPSLLPRWRGPSPIQYTILHGDAETGVTIIEMDKLMDHGPIIAKEKIKMENGKITYPQLHDALAEVGAKLLIETLPRWCAGEITPLPQDDTKATYSKIIKKDDGRIDWSRPAEEIERMVRAFNPWPGAWTVWPSTKKIMRLRIEEACTDAKTQEGPLGMVAHYDHAVLWVKTRKGSLGILKILPEGKKSMSVSAFFRGHANILHANLI